MLKKICTLLVVLIALLSLCACGKTLREPSSPTKPTRTDPTTTTAAEQTVPTTLPETQPAVPVPTEPQEVTIPTTTQPAPTEPAPTEPTPTEPTPTEPAPIAPPVVTPPVPVYGHTALDSREYYQYTQMTAQQQQLYSKLVAGIEQAKMEILVTGITIKTEEALAVLHRLLADNPQYFWVSRSSSVIYDSRTQVVEKYIILYTDGEQTDTVNSRNVPVAKADRAKISAKWTALETKIKEILGTIPSNISRIDQEKAIHDYIVANVYYDYAAAGSASLSDAVLPHAYDIYGAAVEGKAVCEGYAKLFQYLCYRVGINATQIVGTANGGSHMWNVVSLDSQWYEIDVTWDDSDDEVPNFAYFNLTKQEMGKTHAADTSKMPYPNADGTKYSYVAYYALKAMSPTQLSDNYKTVVDDLIAAGSGYLILYKNGVNLTGADYNALIFNHSASIHQYAHSRGYTLEIARSYLTSGEYVYFSYTAKPM